MISIADSVMSLELISKTKDSLDFLLFKVSSPFVETLCVF